MIDNKNDKNKAFRPSAVPLVTVDPYFSIWSMCDKLNDGVTSHWTGRRNPMTAGVVIDNKLYILMGELEADSDRRTYGYYPIIPQKSLEVTPTRTIYVFENDIIKVQLVFTSPMLLDNLKVMSRPVSYIEYDIETLDNAEHDVSFYFDISAECCIDDREAEVEFKRTDISLSCGNTAQNVLHKSGDSVCIDWGYLHIADKNAKVFNGKKRCSIKNNYAEELDETKCLSVFDSYPCIGIMKNDFHGVITLAYDDIKSIEYFGKQLDGYYKHFYSGFEEMLKSAISDYDTVKQMCIKFDNSLMDEARNISDKYEKIVSLTYRQVVAAHKLVENTDGELLFFSKECHSNGCIGTLDITYPSAPLFLKYNPELVNAMLRPILFFAQTDKWQYEFAPHDIGQYPLANGQVYGYEKTNPDDILAMQMPVEECGNMLISLYAVIKYGGTRDVADKNKQILKQWADYLVKYGYDPGEQLCTDDFASHMAHNCNLSIKAILGIAAYGKIFSDKNYVDIAEEYAKKWQLESKGKQASRLALDKEDSWSLKYNIIWDKLLDIHIFDDEIFEKEIQLYKEKMNAYGIPLDCREDYTKMDWLFWTTVMTDDKEYTNKVIDSVYRFINETTDRVPVTDWYYSSIPRMASFQNRTVLGGIFVNII